MRTLIAAGTIVTMDGTRRILRDGGVLVSDGMIEAVLPKEELPNVPGPVDETVDAGTLTLIPGFVQTHIHLCQTLMRGLADDLELLDWLKKRIFPLEAAHTASSMYASALLGIAELVRSGTTTIMDMGSIHHEEEVVRAIEQSGPRACVGKSLIDTNTIYPPLQECTERALADARRQCEDLARRRRRKDPLSGCATVRPVLFGKTPEGVIRPHACGSRRALPHP